MLCTKTVMNLLLYRTVELHLTLVEMGVSPFLLTADRSGRQGASARAQDALPHAVVK